MKITRRLTLTAVAATAVSVSAVALVSAVPEIAPALALGGILACGATLSALLAMSNSRGKTPALVTFAMFVSLLPLLAVAGETAIPLWLACWAFVGVASKKISMQALVERVTRTAA
jgi:hypothetical protein